MRIRAFTSAAGLLAAAAFCSAAATPVSADEKSKQETKEVSFGELKLKVPKDWKEQKPTSSLRLGQLEIPAAKGEKEAVEMVVFSFAGGGGSVAQNIPRWVGEFSATGRKAEIVSGKSKMGEYVLANITGSHLGPGFRRRAKPLENARMVVLRLVDSNDKVYYLKAAGGDKTVTGVIDALRNAIGADKKSEKPVKTTE